MGSANNNLKNMTRGETSNAIVEESPFPLCPKCGTIHLLNIWDWLEEV